MTHKTINEFIGQTFESVEVSLGKDEITFTTVDGRVFVMYHEQDCCEYVTVESITGYLADLIGEPVLLAEEVRHEDVNPEGVTPPGYQESWTWTFYKFATRKGYVDIRWYGGSNGCYSEKVSIAEVTNNKGN